MDSTTPELEAALMQWVNSFEVVDHHVSTWADLEDGRILWQILADLDREHFSGDLPETDDKVMDNWIPKWQNRTNFPTRHEKRAIVNLEAVKHIDRAITTYLSEVCERPGAARRVLNLKAIAIDGSRVDTILLVKAVFLVSMYSPKSNTRMVQVLGKLGTAVGAPLANMIGELEELNQATTGEENISDLDSPSDSEPPSRGPSISRDPDLEREELLIKANQETKRLQAEVAARTVEVEEKRQKVLDLEEELAESRLQLDQRNRRSSDADEVQKLRMQSLRDRDYISGLESDLADARSAIEAQEKQLERLKADQVSKQELRDELQLIKSERDELSQKAKASENLRKKIEALQAQQRGDQNLREQLQEAQEQLRELDTIRDKCAALVRANEENMETIANGEQEIFEQKAARKRVEHELKVVSNRWEQSREMANRYQEMNQDLESKVRELEDRSTDAENMESLEQQLASPDEDAGAESRKSLTGAEAADIMILQQKVDMLQSRCTRMEEKYLDVFQENLGLQSAISDGQAAKPEGDDPFVHQTNRLHALEAEHKELTTKFHAVSTKNMELQHQLAELSGSSDRQGASGADYKALSDNYEALLATHDQLQKHSEKLETQLEDERSLLRHRLLDPEALRNEDAEVARSNEYKTLMEQLQIFKDAPAEESKQISHAIIMGVLAKMNLGQADLETSQKQIAEQDSIIRKLRQDAERLKKEASDKAAVNVQQELLNLQRENKLITSAWYDMTNRLQSNTVVLQRRSEAPKSWLGRQRAEVGRAGGMVSGFR